ncbi:MAG: ribosome-associated translation inhibitor RaiA [Chloroflexi bacterium]|nr:ribosome-associated translation inhibitor RaiA [Chloroflexota bacterium]MBI3733731.1 ribosome-associated translation inhibitor RaiA [Chloroflexota bacterium]
MQLSITGRNVEVTNYTHSYVEKKMQRLDRHLPGMTEARVELAMENTRGAEQRSIVQVTVRAGSKILRGEERAADLFTALDAVMDTMVRQVERFKSKRQRHRVSKGLRETAAELANETMLAENYAEWESDLYEPIVRTKRFQTSPMLPEEAIEQMELLGHTFFVFYNANDGQVNVVYRRQDNNYGLLIPELA